MSVRLQYVSLFTDDVARGGYKPTVVADPIKHANNLIEGLTDAEVSRLLRELRAEIRMVERLTCRPKSR